MVVENKNSIMRIVLGSILVFLPGFEDMSMVNKVIVEELINKDNLKITIYMLHSMMQVIFIILLSIILSV